MADLLWGGGLTAPIPALKTLAFRTQPEAVEQADGLLRPAGRHQGRVADARHHPSDVMLHSPRQRPDLPLGRGEVNGEGAVAGPGPLADQVEDGAPAGQTAEERLADPVCIRRRRFGA